MAVIELTKDNFEQVVTGHKTVIVDFWAPWCGPCRAFAPTFEKVAEAYAADASVAFAKLNTENEQEIAAHFNIRSIPTLMVFREQIIVYAQPGALPKSGLEQIVAKSLELDMDQIRAEIAKQEAEQPAA